MFWKKNNGCITVRSPSLIVQKKAVNCIQSAWLLYILLYLTACGGNEPPVSAPAPVKTQSPAESRQVVNESQSASGLTTTNEDEISLEKILESASVAVSEQRLVSPAGNNAVEYYLQVLLQDPENTQAHQALVDILPLVANIAEHEIQAKQFEEAQRIVTLLLQVDSGSYTVNKLQSKLTKAENAVNEEQKKAELARVKVQEETKKPIVEANQSVTNIPRQELAYNTVEQSNNSNFSNIVNTVPASENKTAPMENNTVESQIIQPQVTQASPPTSQQTEPQEEAKPVVSGETRDARIVKQIAPSYPREAMRRRVEGWVEVEFTVAANGKVQNVKVTDAEPSRVFDREAIRAVQQWFFEPALANGKPVSINMQRRIEFQL